MNTFGLRLRQARARLNWTQKKLAEASGLSQSAIGNYESGQRSSSRALLRLADALGVAPQWLDSGHPDNMDGYQRPPSSERLLQDNSASEPSQVAWPFARTPYQHYLQLTPRDQHMLGSLVDDFIRHCLDNYLQSDEPGRTPPEP